MSKKAWEHSGHAPGRSSCASENLGAVSLLSPLTGVFSGRGVAEGLVRDWGRHPDQNPYPDRSGSLGARKAVHIATSASASVTGARHGRGRGRRRREPSVGFCAVWASWAALVMYNKADRTPGHGPLDHRADRLPEFPTRADTRRPTYESADERDARGLGSLRAAAGR